MLFGLAASTAAADPRYEVMNAPEGVYWRSEPNWAAAERVSGFGVYNGTIIEVHCCRAARRSKRSADTMWEQANDVGKRTRLWRRLGVNEQYRDGQPINQSGRPGVGPCNPHRHRTQGAPPPPGRTACSGGGLVFRSSTRRRIYYRNRRIGRDTSATGARRHDGDRCARFVDFGDA